MRQSHEMTPVKDRKKYSTNTTTKNQENVVTPAYELKRKRFCTDIPCCIIFLVFIICFVILSIFAFKEGDPRQLVYPTDSQGNLCGVGNHSDRPYVYFFDWTKCIKMLNIPANMLEGRPFVCPTTQVCVKECPKTNSYYKFRNSYDNKVCTYEANPTRDEYERFVEDSKCASFVITSKSLFGRCVPVVLNPNIITTKDDSGFDVPIIDSSGEFLNGSKLEKGANYLVDLLNLKQTATFLVEDFATAWSYILIGLAFAAIISFVWIVLMRWFVAPIVWLGIILCIVLLAIICGLSIMEFLALREKNGNQIANEFKFVADANYYRSLPITWLVIGILSGLLLIIAILILLALFKHLRRALAILKEASKAVGFNLLSLFWPIIPLLLHIGVFAYWVAVSLHLATAGKPIFRVAFNESNLNINDSQYGEICDPNKWNNTNGTMGDCVFWEYGYNPKVDLDSILAGTGKHFNAFIVFVNQNQWLPQVFSAFMLYWLTAFVTGFSQLVLAGVYVRYYWDKERLGLPCMSLTESLLRAIVFHLGTIAFGSFIIALVKIFRAILQYTEKKLKDKVGKVARCVFCCCRCCLFCLEKFLKFLNRNAYIVTAIEGKGFFRSARRAFSIILSNPLNTLVVNKVCDFLIFIGKLCITGGIGTLTFFFFTHRIAAAEKFVPELHYYLIPLLLITIGAYVIASCFFSVYSMAVNTLFICALEDLRLSEKHKGYTMVMPKGLQKVFGAKKNK